MLSGIGFESGGHAVAHGVAQSYTAIADVHANYLHGEMVAMGTLTQLMMESRPDEAKRVAEFFASVGLPLANAGLLHILRQPLNRWAIVGGPDEIRKDLFGPGGHRAAETNG